MGGPQGGPPAAPCLESVLAQVGAVVLRRPFFPACQLNREREGFGRGESMWHNRKEELLHIYRMKKFI